VIRNNKLLRERIQVDIKLERLRTLATIVLGRVSTAFVHKTLLEALVDQDRKSEFVKLAARRSA
jgi:hypothetical protein